MMTKLSKSFTLSFDAPHWSTEEAVPCIFFGDLDVADPQLVAQEIVKYVVNENEGAALKAQIGNQFQMVVALQMILIRLLPSGATPSRKNGYHPLVWCRLAVQFWLKYGGRQESFLSTMTQWIKANNKGGVAFVSYKCNGISTRRKIPLGAFLFGGAELPDLVQTEWLYKRRSVNHLPKGKSKPRGGRSDENQVGSNLLGAVKNAVAELAKNKRGKMLFLRTPDPATGKFRYKGLRGELYANVCTISPDISGERQLKNKRKSKAYAESAVLKAISKVVICRRSWA